MPLKNKSSELINYIRKETNGELFIIGSGGIFTGADETKGFAINELGNVGIGVTTQNQGEKLYVNGAVKVNGNLNANGGYYMVAGLATNQTITNTGITIPMTDKDDPNNWWDASNYRFQPTVAGYYFATGISGLIGLVYGDSIAI